MILSYLNFIILIQVRGEMREAYEEISGCPEEIMYPMLDGMEIAHTTEQPHPQSVVVHNEHIVQHQDMNHGIQEEALRDANNYVCSEMLDCSWATEAAVNGVAHVNGVRVKNCFKRFQRLFFSFQL